MLSNTLNALNSGQSAIMSTLGGPAFGQITDLVSDTATAVKGKPAPLMKDIVRMAGPPGRYFANAWFPSGR
jgi:hypothetical protein